MEENFEINNEDDLKEIESEILANRADALLSSNMNENDKLDKNPSSSRAQNYSSYNDSNLSSQGLYLRGIKTDCFKCVKIFLLLLNF